LSGTIESLVSSYGLVGTSAASRRHFWNLNTNRTLTSDYINAYAITTSVNNIFRSNGVTTSPSPINETINNNTLISFVTSFDSGGINRSINGLSVNTVLSSLIFSNYTELGLGYQTDLLRFLNGHFKKLNYWPFKITNAEVQAFSKL
jgi:hypothetical protein